MQSCKFGTGYQEFFCEFNNQSVRRNGRMQRYIHLQIYNFMSTLKFSRLKHWDYLEIIFS